MAEWSKWDFFRNCLLRSTVLAFGVSALIADICTFANSNKSTELIVSRRQSSHIEVIR